MTSPLNNTVHKASSTITLTATATESGTTISEVNFYDGAILIKSITTGPYTYSWASATTGNHALTAVATDANNHTATSGVINITVH